MASKGSKKTGFFLRVGDAVLGAWKLPGKLKRKVRKPKVKPAPKPKREIPLRLRGFFERRHAGWSEYVMLKVQLAVLVMFAVVVIYLVFLPTEILIFIPVLLAFSAYLVYLAATQLKQAFERDYPAYRSFVGFMLAMVWIFVGFRYLPIEFTLESIYMYLIFPLALFGLVATAFVAFRLKYGRNFTYGTVEEVQGRRAVVRVGYDICSNVKAGLYTVESFIKVRRGDLVKLSVERPLLGLRGAKITAILAKAK
jgi:uncharacterized membrane protein